MSANEPFGENVLVQLSPFELIEFKDVKRNNERGAYIAHVAVIKSKTDNVTYNVNVRKRTYDMLRLRMIQNKPPVVFGAEEVASGSNDLPPDLHISVWKDLDKYPTDSSDEFDSSTR